MNNLTVYQDKFAASGLKVFERAIEEARRRNQNYVSLGHLLIALDAKDGGSFRCLVGKLRADHGLTVDLVPADKALEKLMEWSPKYEGEGVRIGPETKNFCGELLRSRDPTSVRKSRPLIFCRHFYKSLRYLMFVLIKVCAFDS
jgi:hypothetical protein